MYCMQTEKEVSTRLTLHLVGGGELHLVEGPAVHPHSSAVQWIGEHSAGHCVCQGVMD